MSSPVKVITYIVLVPILLLALAALLVPLLLDKDKVLELAASTLHEQTGATLTVDGDSRLSFFPTLGIALGKAGLAMPGEDQPSLRVRALDIGVQFMPLLSGRVEIDSISLDGLTLRIESDEQTPASDTSGFSDEQLDAFYAKRRQTMEAAGNDGAAEAAIAVPMALKVQHLSITDSRIEQVDTATKTTTVIELDRFEAKGLNLDANPIPLEARLKLPGETPLEISIEGVIRIDEGGQKLILDKLEAELTGITVQPLKLRTRGEVNISRQVAELKLALVTGETEGEGTVRYANFESPQIDANLHFNLLDPAMLALAGPEAAAEAGAANEGESSGDEPLPLAALRSIDTRAELSIDRAVFDAHVINQLQVKLRAVDGVIELSSLTGELHQGQLDMQATFNAKHNTAALTTRGSLNQLDIATALAAAAVEPVLTGTAGLDWKLTGKGRTRNELIAALNGPVVLATEQVVLKEVAIEQMLCQAVALTNKEVLTARFPADTSFQTLGADIQLADGKAQLNPLRAELPQITLAGTGAFDLLNQDFDTTFKARLSPELETLDHACRVSKRLTAIDWPVNCAGNTATDPGKWCSVDSASIIQDLGKNEAERKVKKEAGKLFNKLFNKDK